MTPPHDLDRHPLEPDDVLDAIYLCAVDPETWPELLDALSTLDVANPGALDALRRHFERAGDLAMRIPAIKAGAPDDPSEALNGVAEIVIDARRRIVTANAAASDALTDIFGDLAPRMRLTARDPDLDHRLTEALQTARRDAFAPLLIRSDGVALRLIYLAAREDSGWTLIAAGHAPEARAPAELDVLTRFDLTPAEARLARRLHVGERVRVAAERMGVSEHTARTQLKSVYAKLGVNRLPELVRLLGEAAALAPHVQARGAAIDADNVSCPARRFLKLAGGRDLAYRIYGDPEGAPVVYNPGAIQASALPPDHDARAAAAGIRLIAFDRPGMGRSSRNPGRRPRDVAADIVALLDHLGIERATLFGVLAGTPYALAQANALQDRAAGVLLLNPHFMAAPSGLAASNPGPIATLLRSHLWVAPALARILVRPLTRGYIERQVARLYTMGEADERALKDAALRAALVDMAIDMMERDVSGIVDDFRFAATPEEIATQEPISVWFAGGDPMTHDEAVHEMLKQFNVVRTKHEPEFGRLIIHQRWDAFMSDAARIHFDATRSGRG